jgi:hypothetical protein
MSGLVVLANGWVDAVTVIAERQHECGVGSLYSGFSYFFVGRMMHNIAHTMIQKTLRTARPNRTHTNFILASMGASVLATPALSLSQMCQLDPLNHFSQRSQLAEEVSELSQLVDFSEQTVLLSWAQFHAEAVGRLISTVLDYAQLFV